MARICAAFHFSSDENFLTARTAGMVVRRQGVGMISWQEPLLSVPRRGFKGPRGGHLMLIEISTATHCPAISSRYGISGWSIHRKP